MGALTVSQTTSTVQPHDVKLASKNVLPTYYIIPNHSYAYSYSAYYLLALCPGDAENLDEDGFDAPGGNDGFDAPGGNDGFDAPGGNDGFADGKQVSVLPAPCQHRSGRMRARSTATGVSAMLWRVGHWWRTGCAVDLGATHTLLLPLALKHGKRTRKQTWTRAAFLFPAPLFSLLKTPLLWHTLLCSTRQWWLCATITRYPRFIKRIKPSPSVWLCHSTGIERIRMSRVHFLTPTVCVRARVCVCACVRVRACVRVCVCPCMCVCCVLRVACARGACAWPHAGDVDYGDAEDHVGGGDDPDLYGDAEDDGGTHPLRCSPAHTLSHIHS